MCSFKNVCVLLHSIEPKSLFGEHADSLPANYHDTKDTETSSVILRADTSFAL